MSDATSEIATREVASIPRHDNGPVFREPWEANAFAMAVTLHRRGVFTWKEWVAVLGEEIKRAQAAGDPDTGETYYRHWLDIGKAGGGKGSNVDGDAPSLPRRLGPCRRPHAARQADRTQGGGFWIAQ